MKNKKTIIPLIILGMVIIILGVVISLININNKKNDIPDGYIAVFHGGVGEITYETYIYKINNGHGNLGFDYINVTSTTKSWGSSEWNSKVTKRGSVDWTDDVFIIAKENNAYSYVTVPDSDVIYTIEEFMDKFIMD